MSISARVVSASAVAVVLLIAGLIVGSLINVVTHAPQDNGAAAVLRSASASPPGVVIGEVKGVALPTSPPPATPAPIESPSGSPGTSLTASSPPSSPSPSAASTPENADGFSAEVLVCGSVSGSKCHDETTTISSSTRTIWIMVRFENAGAGDRIGMGLSGPGGSRDGGSYTVKGGDGRAWSQVSGQLPPGDYTVTATRNDQAVAQSTLHVD